jgi:hypothetical protein
MKATVHTLTVDDDGDKINGPVTTTVHGSEAACWASLRANYDPSASAPRATTHCWSSCSSKASRSGSTKTVIDVPAPIEILHVRDPDGGCDTTVWIDGVPQATGVTIEDVDAGRGYTREYWDERIAETQEAPYTEGFKAALLSALDDPPGDQYIEEGA